MMPRKKGFRLQVLVYSILFLSTVICTLSTVRADEIEDLQKQINELSSAREQSVAATKPLEGQLSSLKRQLAQIQTSLDNSPLARAAAISVIRPK